MLINLKCVIEVSDFFLFFPYFLTNYTFKNVAEYQRKKNKNTDFTNAHFPASVQK